MIRNDFILATALILFAAFVLGWFTSWLIARVTRPGRAEIDGHAKLVAELHEAEQARDQAVAEGKQREAALHERLGFATTELASARNALQDAGEEIEELRAYIERNIARPPR
ncbi:hypothetical protein [Paracoccus sediminicola]|uniref:hypothetical protein n=1 Tax=Paracoccus sediminicola TaxID=3017783 RepID=UPI0022F0F2B3|nr:hypothetical protein [Paracoccus sediminicola]WBU58286.1 hypothetical protein PAF18_07655 [Paracoccus sediminicola]